MSNGIKKSNEDIKEKNEEIKKLTNQNDKQQTNGDKLENVPRTYQIVITLRDYYLPKREDEEEMPLDLAIASGRLQVVHLLVEAGGKSKMRQLDFAGYVFGY